MEFLRSFMIKKYFVWWRYALACPSLSMERECFTMNYLSICYFWTMSVMKHYGKMILNILHWIIVVISHSSTSANQWVKCVCVLWLHVQQKTHSFQISRNWVVAIAQCIIITSQVCLNMSLYFYPCENWSCVPIPYDLLTAYILDYVLITIVFCFTSYYTIQEISVLYCFILTV